MAPAMRLENNPYAPPKTLNLELPSGSGARSCKHVEWACTLLWIGMGLSLLEFVLTTIFNPDSGNLAADIVGGLISLGVVFALTYWSIVKLRAGRNWMRWLFTILSILSFLIVGLVATVIPRSMFVEIFAAGPLPMANTGIQVTLCIVEVVLINTPTARRWFHAQGFG